ncbi:MAG TPA: hypothetical protein VGD56_01725 [Gemmatirosa sp.]
MHTGPHPVASRAGLIRGAVAVVAWVTLALGVSPTAAAAHLGTNDAVFEGRAGPYAVRVIVRMPGVIPGQAEVTVRVDGGAARAVRVQVAQWSVGTRGAPAPEAAMPVPGAAGVWSAPLWLMTTGSYEANVTVDGTQGTGTVTVPVVAVATARLGMDQRLGWLLAALGIVLVAGLVSVAGAAARDGTLTPGAAIDRAARRTGRVATAVAAAVCALALVGGAKWWGADDAAYASGLWRPLRSEAHVRTGSGGPRLHFTITDSAWFAPELTPLMPDHGKLMHLFAVRESATAGANVDPAHRSRDVLAHLHPVRVDRADFDAPLPALPGGRYRVYADVVHESGLARTLVTTVDLAAPQVATPAGGSDAGDDAWDVAGAASAGAVAPLGAGDGMTMESAARIPAGRDTVLRFTVRDAAGRVVDVEPYLGMAAHAMIERSDGSVFVHLHPSGTVSMAAQDRLLRREQGDTALHGASQPDAMAAMHGTPAAYSGALGFPFSFPRPGGYRVWVQVRIAGHVRTAAFDVTAI